MCDQMRLVAVTCFAEVHLIPLPLGLAFTAVPRFQVIWRLDQPFAGRQVALLAPLELIVIIKSPRGHAGRTAGQLQDCLLEIPAQLLSDSRAVHRW
jgi:hypothetical protein